jgi:L-iditol 2-dehydrogenase
MSPTKFAASYTYKSQGQSPERNAKQLLEQGNDDDGVDIIVDATSAEPCIECGVWAMKRGGVLVKAGLGSPSIAFLIDELCVKEVSLKGSFRYGPGDYRLAIALLDSKRIRLGNLVTQEFEFSEAEKAFHNVKERNGIKTIVHGPVQPMAGRNE